MTSTHAQWGSRLGFILAATGSAVGLGNIWKFPYMTGVSGGSAFVITYLLCITLIGVPILVMEWLIGRRAQMNPIQAMEHVAVSEKRSPAWKWLGVTGVLGAFLILSFYSVIGGWALDYLVLTGSGTFSGMTGKDTEAVFKGFLANSGSLLLWHTVFMGLTMGIVALGVTSGLERASKIMMPALFAVLLVLVANGMFATDAFGRTLAFLFAPNWKAVTGNVVLAALGHAFFTLSLGMGIMTAYGAYLGKEVNLLSAARTVVILDTAVALMAGMAIFPLVFSHGLEPSSGPGLIFVTLPIAFGNMPGGALLGTLFFILLTFAALTSSMSLLEPVVALLEQKTALGRKSATLISGAVIWLLGVASLLSFNQWSDVQILGNSIFDFLDKLTSKFMLPLTGLGIIIFSGWFMNQEGIRQELGLHGAGYRIWSIVSRFVAPLGVIAVFVSMLAG